MKKISILGLVLAAIYLISAINIWQHPFSGGGFGDFINDQLRDTWAKNVFEPVLALGAPKYLLAILNTLFYYAIGYLIGSFFKKSPNQ